MCGLVGIVGGAVRGSELMRRIEDMKRAIVHRGPDDHGSYLDPERSAVALGHQRLAIIDPEHGQQPMITSDGQLIIVFNGAIYNYLELRRELNSRGHSIHSYSDTEVLLYAYQEWGEACVDKLNGMFAFAIWDRRKNKLFCARDRVGIKPFYYFFNGQSFVFASEIKAILASGFIRAESNFAGIQDYITFQFCVGDKTLFKNIKKLEPGCSLAIHLDSSQNIRLENKKYWDVDYTIDEQHDESYFVDHLTTLLENSIRQQLRSDVPLGAHLSGGLDSSAVVSLAATMLESLNLKTFTGAFREGTQFDETGYAREVASQAGAEYHETYIPSHEFSDILPKLMYYMDEPMAGPGIIPQYYVSKLASEHVKVVLGGQGGDELYVGYARYLVAYLEKCLLGAINQTADNGKYAITLDRIVPNLPLLNNYTPMMQNFFKEGLFQSDDQRYFRLIDRSEGTKQLFNPEIFRGYSSFEQFQHIFNRDDLHSYINHMTYFDLKASLPALLQVEDRTSMAVSIESRVPLLDHRLVEHIASIPPNIKFANGVTKHLFRQSIKNIVPKKILERKDKMGFPVPLNQWIKNQSRDFVGDILLSQRARERGIYNIAAVERAWQDESQYGRVIWGLLCLELWHRIYIDGDFTAQEYK